MLPVKIEPQKCPWGGGGCFSATVKKVKKVSLGKWQSTRSSAIEFSRELDREVLLGGDFAHIRAQNCLLGHRILNSLPTLSA